MRTVAVTGATSDFGRAIVPRLLADPGIERVVGLGRRPSPLRHDKFTYERQDIRDPGVERVLSGCDAVVHLAFAVEEGRDKRLMNEINVGGSVNVLNAAHRAGVGHFVFASSINAYGPPRWEEPVTEDQFPTGDRYCYYAYDKAQVEHYIDWWSRRHPGAMDIAVLRPTYVVGEGFDNDGIRSMAAGVCALPDAASASYQFLHGDDLAEAFHLALAHRLTGAFNIGPEDRTLMAELAKVHGQRMFSVPEGVARPMADALYRLRLTPYSAEWVASGEPPVDSAAFRKATGWEPALTSDEAAALMLLHQGRRLLDPDAMPRREAACERILGATTRHVRAALAVEGGAGGAEGDGSALDLFEQGVRAAGHSHRLVGGDAVHTERHGHAHGPDAGPDAASGSGAVTDTDSGTDFHSDVEIVLVPPPGTHARFCTHVAAALGARWPVSVLDPPGTGLSSGRRAGDPRGIERAVRYCVNRARAAGRRVVVAALDGDGALSPRSARRPELLCGTGRAAAGKGRAWRLPDAPTVSVSGSVLDPAAVPRIVAVVSRAAERETAVRLNEPAVKGS